MVGYRSYWRNHPEQLTSPLPSSVIIHLCTILERDKTDHRCQGKKTYTFEFFQDIYDRYTPVIEWMPMQQVDNEIGIYLKSCTEWKEIPLAGDSVADGFLRKCSYDFHGDGNFVLDITFRTYGITLDETTGKVFFICADTKYDSYNIRDDCD
jgi:hypothetical protein